MRRRASHLGPERRRPLVLDAALEVFVERGYFGSTMAAIADAAGVTKPVVYECYPNKEGVYAALLDREEQRLLAAVRAALPDRMDGGDLQSMLTGGMAALFTAATSAPNSWRVVYDTQHGHPPAVADRVHQARQSVLGALGSLVTAYLAERSVEESDKIAPVLAEVIASTAEAGVRILLSGSGGWRPVDLATWLSALLVEGADQRFGAVGT
ncbi:MAG TPA: TetR/AcrR family transcriptional regulator [Nocardioidaceae bacterium]|nr:TetR/AcrR family transcriptional regulator [Nocardioidaceae bacterium]